MPTHFDELLRCVAAGDWDGVERLAALLQSESIPEEPGAIGEYRERLEGALDATRTGREELGLSLVRVRAADGFVRQGFGTSPES